MISIVIPVYNTQSSLEHTLASLEAQTHQDIEVIVVDDGSLIPISIKASYVFPVHLIRQKNAGAPRARNTGRAYAKGEYLLFLDADVICEPTMLEEMHHALDSHPTHSIAYADFYFGKKLMKAQPWNVPALKKRNYITTMSLVRSSNAPQWDGTLKKFQDWDYFLKMAEAGATGVYIDHTLFSVQTGGTMSLWLPRYAYYPPFKWIPGISRRVRIYEEARAVIRAKHDLPHD